jgi:superfamily II DNA or RNA helicase
MKLRSYQVKLNRPALKFLKAKKGQRAQVYAPTGAGKTVCFNELIKDAIARGKTNICILHPRIALSKDQLRRFKEELGNSVITSSFHSGGHVKGYGEEITEIGTISKDKLLKVIDQSRTLLNKPHVTFSSYHSFHQLTDVHFDIVICDEAHYMVQDQFYEWITKINADKILFYTATPITNDMEDGLMSDYSIFGNIIAKVEPRELIKPGYILAPLIHQMECGTNKRGSEVDVIDVVSRAYVDQYFDMTGYGMPYHQMLVACRNVDIDIREIENRLDELWTKISQFSQGRISKVDVYTIEAGGSYKNKLPMKDRDQALEEIKSAGKNCIVAHYDTLSEGIDINTLSGALLLRKMSKAKLIQTIGRCARPYIEDLDPKTKEPRKDLYNLENNIDLRKKPRCIVTLPVVDGKWIANDDGTVIARAFAAAGYEDLYTYMSKSDDQPTGRRKNSYILSEDGTVMSAVINHKVEKELKDLKKLFDFE